ncbi:MAG: homoprotocatechuate degradation operon regulator HpaR, partial [Hyphomicrobiales bacterium]|nr:homoprotocatechuate degradation operon regulator HpaR [Hyphomicrobiales bacterium]
LRAREAVMSQFRPILAAHNVTEQQWRVIRVLAETDEIDAGELAERSCILAPSLTRILRALEERGLIARRRDLGDGRRSIVWITPAGLAFIRKVTPESAVIYAELEARYGRDRIERLLDLLTELGETAKAKE